ncbi:MAG: hypothetical protein ACI8W7_000222 [Gammaproteobacteria bacterium]|jgi:hypothetical protein
MLLTLPRSDATAEFPPDLPNDGTTASAGGDNTLNGGQGNDVLKGGSGDDKLNGHAGNARLSGGQGDDVLKGGGGDDLLQGGQCDDIVFGGAGDDTFTFSPFEGNDTFHGGQGWTDTIRLDADADPNADPGNPWEISVNGEEVEYALAMNSLEVDAGLVGVITLSDGSELTFDGVKSITW